MDALNLLEQDHQKVKKLMSEIEKTTERGVKTREQLFSKLVTELTVHEKIEEKIFPLVNASIQDEKRAHCPKYSNKQVSRKVAVIVVVTHRVLERYS